VAAKSKYDHQALLDQQRYGKEEEAILAHAKSGKPKKA
jgi:hypothetical protein